MCAISVFALRQPANSPWASTVAVGAAAESGSRLPAVLNIILPDELKKSSTFLGTLGAGTILLVNRFAPAQDDPLSKATKAFWGMGVGVMFLINAVKLTIAQIENGL